MYNGWQNSSTQIGKMSVYFGLHKSAVNIANMLTLHPPLTHYVDLRVWYGDSLLKADTGERLENGGGGGDGGDSGFQATGMIEGFFWVWNRIFLWWRHLLQLPESFSLFLSDTNQGCCYLRAPWVLQNLHKKVKTERNYGSCSKMTPTWKWPIFDSRNFFE